MHGETSSNIYQKKFQRSTTISVRTGKPQTSKPVFLENMILQLLLFKNLRQTRVIYLHNLLCGPRTSSNSVLTSEFQF